MKLFFDSTGDGGIGGIPGPAGSIYLTGFDNLPERETVDGKNNIFIQIGMIVLSQFFIPGVKGLNGKGGSPGNPAPNGRIVDCTIWNNSLVWGRPVWFVFFAFFIKLFMPIQKI